jgi:hypothetical protein
LLCPECAEKAAREKGIILYWVAKENNYPNWTFYVDIHIGEVDMWDIPDEYLVHYLALSEEEE